MSDSQQHSLQLAGVIRGDLYTPHQEVKKSTTRTVQLKRLPVPYFNDARKCLKKQEENLNNKILTELVETKLRPENLEFENLSLIIIKFICRKNLGGKFINQILEIVDHVKGNPYDFLLKNS